MSTFGAFTVTRASTKLRIGSNGLYGSVANNVPAFEFNTDGSYRGLLVEPGATNLFLRSQEINTTWTASNVTVTPNTTASPDGTVTADSVILNDTTASYNVNQTISFTTGTVYTISGYFKADGLRYIQMSFNATPFTNAGLANFDLQDGVVTSVSGGTARIELVGNGFYRCSFTNTCNVTTSAPQVLFFAIDSPTATRAPSFANSGANGYFVWQAQLETGSVATSPIVTTAGTASRVADVVSLTGASSLIGQTSGTLYIESELLSYTPAASTIIAGVATTSGVDMFSNGICIALTATNPNRPRARVSDAGSNTMDIQMANDRPAGIYRFALGYASNDGVFYANGAQIGTDNSVTVGANSEVLINYSGIAGTPRHSVQWIRSVALFPTRLANATLASITA